MPGDRLDRLVASSAPPYNQPQHLMAVAVQRRAIVAFEKDQDRGQIKLQGLGW